MRRKIPGALRDEAGYVAVLALIAMPLLLGFSLLVIDVARGNNLHTDLQNAVDGLALAGARELDGGSDAIIRAEAAMTDHLNNEARFSDGGGVIISRDDVEALYYEEIPALDDEPIAAFRRVRLRDVPMEPDGEGDTTRCPFPGGIGSAFRSDSSCASGGGYRPDHAERWRIRKLYGGSVRCGWGMTRLVDGNDTWWPGLNFFNDRIGANNVVVTYQRSGLVIGGAPTDPS